MSIEKNKNLHTKVYCADCGRLLQHHVTPDLEKIKNFLKLEIQPCPDCIKGAVDHGYFDGLRDAKNR